MKAQQRVLLLLSIVRQPLTQFEIEQITGLWFPSFRLVNILANLERGAMIDIAFRDGPYPRACCYAAKGEMPEHGYSPTREAKARSND